MVLTVNGAMAEEYRNQGQGGNSIPIANVVEESFQILKKDTGAGRLIQPSTRELHDCFGTTDQVKMAQIMLERGKLHGKADTMNANFFATT